MAKVIVRISNPQTGVVFPVYYDSADAVWKQFTGSSIADATGVCIMLWQHKEAGDYYGEVLTADFSVATADLTALLQPEPFTLQYNGQQEGVQRSSFSYTRVTNLYSKTDYEIALNGYTVVANAVTCAPLSITLPPMYVGEEHIETVTVGITEYYSILTISCSDIFTSFRIAGQPEFVKNLTIDNVTEDFSIEIKIKGHFSKIAQSSDSTEAVIAFKNSRNEIQTELPIEYEIMPVEIELTLLSNPLIHNDNTYIKEYSITVLGEPENLRIDAPQSGLISSDGINYNRSILVNTTHLPDIIYIALSMDCASDADIVLTGATHTLYETTPYQIEVSYSRIERYNFTPSKLLFLKKNTGSNIVKQFSFKSEMSSISLIYPFFELNLSEELALLLTDGSALLNFNGTSIFTISRSSSGTNPAFTYNPPDTVPFLQKRIFPRLNDLLYINTDGSVGLYKNIEGSFIIGRGYLDNNYIILDDIEKDTSLEWVDLPAVPVEREFAVPYTLTPYKTGMLLRGLFSFIESGTPDTYQIAVLPDFEGSAWESIYPGLQGVPMQRGTITYKDKIYFIGELENGIRRPSGDYSTVFEIASYDTSENLTAPIRFISNYYHYTDTYYIDYDENFKHCVIWEDKLVVAGEFNSFYLLEEEYATEHPCYPVIAYDGTTWQSLGGDLQIEDSDIVELAVLNHSLYRLCRIPYIGSTHKFKIDKYISSSNTWLNIVPQFDAGDNNVHIITHMNRFFIMSDQHGWTITPDSTHSDLPVTESYLGVFVYEIIFSETGYEIINPIPDIDTMCSEGKSVYPYKNYLVFSGAFGKPLSDGSAPSELYTMMLFNCVTNEVILKELKEHPSDTSGTIYMYMPVNDRIIRASVYLSLITYTVRMAFSVLKSQTFPIQTASEKFTASTTWATIDLPHGGAIVDGIMQPASSALTTHIVYKRYYLNEILFVEGVPLQANSLIPYVEAEEITGEVAFTAEVTGHYTGELRVVDLSYTPYLPLEGDVYNLLDLIRLGSNTSKKYGYIDLNNETPDTIVWYTSTVGDLSYITLEQQRLYIPDGRTTIKFYRDSKCSSLLYTHTVLHDPFPFYNPELDIPVNIKSGLGKLEPYEQEFLIYTNPVYSNTGDLEIHALITLYELGYLLKLGIESAPTIYSWRSKTLKDLSNTEFTFTDMALLKEYYNLPVPDKLKFVINYLVRKVLL